MSELLQEEATVMVEEKPKNQPGGFGLGSIVLLGSIVIAAVIVGFALMRQNQSQPFSGPAPLFGFTTFDGVTYRLEDFRGKVVVLNFWASWCAPCAYESPALQLVWEDYQDKGVVFIGIAYADNGPNSLRFIERYGLDYLNAPDVGTYISELYHIAGVPETFVIDQSGDIAQFFYAPVNELQLSEVLDPLLEGGTR
jgi:peroxiredoxin